MAPTCRGVYRPCDDRKCQPARLRTVRSCAWLAAPTIGFGELGKLVAPRGLDGAGIGGNDTDPIENSPRLAARAQ